MHIFNFAVASLATTVKGSYFIQIQWFKAICKGFLIFTNHGSVFDRSMIVLFNDSWTLDLIGLYGVRKVYEALMNFNWIWSKKVAYKYCLGTH